MVRDGDTMCVTSQIVQQLLRSRKRSLRRDVRRNLSDSIFIESVDDTAPRGIDQTPSREPTPEFAEQITDQCDELLEQLGDETLEKVAIAKLEGFTNDEIAEQLGVRTRTVERKLRIIREIWSVEQ